MTSNNEEDLNHLLEELNSREVNIRELKNQFQKEREITEAYKSTLIQYQKNGKFIQVSLEPSEGKAIKALEKNNPLILREIQALKDQIADQTRDLQILQIDKKISDSKAGEEESTSHLEELSSFNLQSNIDKIKKEIETTESDISDMKESKDMLKKEIEDEKIKYRDINKRLLTLSNKRGATYQEVRELDLQLLMHDSLKYGESLRERTRGGKEEKQRKDPPFFPSPKSLLTMDQIQPLLKAMHKYKRGERSFLQKLLLSLLETWDTKEALLENEKKSYKTLGQRWVILSKFNEENVILEGIPQEEKKKELEENQGSSASTCSFVEIECRQPNRDEPIFHSPYHTQRKPKIL